MYIAVISLGLLAICHAIITDKHYTQSIHCWCYRMFDQKLNCLVLLCLIACVAIAMPAFADEDDSGLEDSMTFHVYDDVDLVSTLKFEYGKPRIIIKSVYPQLVSETEHEGIVRFNALALEMVKNEIAYFRSKVKENASIQKKMEKNKITNNLYIDYNTSYLKSNRDHIISIRLSAQGYVAGNSRPYQRYSVLNYNLDKTEFIELSDLFRPNSNYLNVLSQYTSQVLYKRLQNKQKIASGTAPMLDNFADWNIKPNGLVITFSDTQVAPHIYGPQTVLVPFSALNEVLSADSPIADCITHHSRCINQNLLTGGFIDEAANTRHRSFDPLLSKS